MASMAHSLTDSSIHPFTHRLEVLRSMSLCWRTHSRLGEATTPAGIVWHNPLGKCKDTVTSEVSFAVFEAGGGQLGRTLGVGDSQSTWIDLCRKLVGWAHSSMAEDLC